MLYINLCDPHYTGKKTESLADTDKKTQVPNRPVTQLRIDRQKVAELGFDPRLSGSGPCSPSCTHCLWAWLWLGGGVFLQTSFVLLAEVSRLRVMNGSKFGGHKVLSGATGPCLPGIVTAGGRGMLLSLRLRCKNGLVMLAFLIYRLPIMRKRLGWMFTQCRNRITPLKKSIKFLQKE